MTRRNRGLTVAVGLITSIFAAGGLAVLGSDVRAAETCGNQRCNGAECEANDSYECEGQWVVFNEQGQPIACQKHFQTGAPCCVGFQCSGGS